MEEGKAGVDSVPVDRVDRRIGVGVTVATDLLTSVRVSDPTTQGTEGDLTVLHRAGTAAEGAVGVVNASARPVIFPRRKN